MKRENTKIDYSPELEILCESARKLMETEGFSPCRKLLAHAMENFPDAPHPHNLMGILWEKQGNHDEAMKHFRAACALDPTYRPSSMNLDTYGTCDSTAKAAYTEEDCERRHLMHFPSFHKRLRQESACARG